MLAQNENLIVSSDDLRDFLLTELLTHLLLFFNPSVHPYLLRRHTVRIERNFRSNIDYKVRAKCMVFTHKFDTQSTSRTPYYSLYLSVFKITPMEL